MRASIAIVFLAACGSASSDGPVTATGASAAVSPGSTERSEPVGLAAEPGEPLDSDDVPDFLRAGTTPVPNDATARLGTLAFQLLDPGTSVQLTFREDRLEVLERVRGELRVRDAATGETLETLAAGRGAITPATRSEDGAWIALGCGTVELQGPDQRFRLSSPSRPPPAELEGMGAVMDPDHYRFRCAAFDADGTRAVIAFETFRAVQRVDLATGEAETVRGVSCRPNAVAMDPNGDRFACTGVGEVSVVEGATARKYEGEGHPKALAFSADGRELAIGYAGEVRIIDASSFEVKARIRTRDDEPTAIALSADGRWIATAASGSIDVWERSSGRPVPRPAGHGGRVTSVRLADGVVLSSGETGEVLRWRIAEPGEPEVLLPAGPRRRLTRSADGRAFAAYWHDRERDEAWLQLLDSRGGVGERHPVPSYAGDVELVADGSALVLSYHAGVAHLALGEERAPTIWRDGRANGRGVPLTDGRIAVGAAHSDATVQILPSGCAPDCDGRPLTTPAQGRPRSGRERDAAAAVLAGEIAAEVVAAEATSVLGGSGRRSPRPSSNRPGPTEHRSGLKDAALAGERIVTASRGGEIHVFDATSLERIGCWSARVERLVAHSSGRVFAMDAIGTLLLLPNDVPTPGGRRCSRLEATRWEGAHEGDGTDLDIGGDVIATAGTDGTIVLWSVPELLAGENDGG